MKISRRAFFGFAGTAVGASAVAAIPLSSDPLYGAEFPFVAENHVDLPPNGKSVCILGGGLAGIQAGVEAAARGFQVTILERSGGPGGKLKTWRDPSFGPDDHAIKKTEGFRGVVREHGAHGIWHSYKNLREFMGRFGYKTQSRPPGSMDYLFVDKDGKRSTVPDFGMPAPYDKVQQLLNVLSMEHPEGLGEQMDLVDALMKMSTYDVRDPKQRDYLDGISFLDYAREIGLSENLIWRFFDPVAEMIYYARVDVVSALAMVTGFMLTAGAPKDWQVDLFASPAGETFLLPMVDFIESKGGRVIYGADVDQVEILEGRVAAVTTYPLPEAFRVRRCSVCGEPLYGDHHHDNCPYCGANGQMLVEVPIAERRAQRFVADDFILAMDVPGLRRFVGLNADVLTGIPYFDKIKNLTASDVFVANFWIEGKTSWPETLRSGDQPVLVFFPTSFGRIGVTFNWTLGGDSTVIREYADHNVTILETHLSRLDDIAHLTNREIADLAYAELREVLPDLPDYTDFYLNKWRNYTGVQVGEEANRPSIASPIENLYAIGDLVTIPHVATGMEKTNVTAKMAVNELIDKYGFEGRIRILQSGSPSLFVDMTRWTKSIYPAGVG